MIAKDLDNAAINNSTAATLRKHPLEL